MKKTVLFITLAIFAGFAGIAQKKTTTSATISFDATTSLDKLPKAENKTVIASLNTKKGTIAFEALIKGFSFSNPKMQEHFNSPNWMQSDSFPRATFKGNFNNLATINFNHDGVYPAEVAGDLTIHGVTKNTTAKGTITVAGSTVTVNADFTIQLADYGINGPAIGAGKVAKDPKISVSAELK